MENVTYQAYCSDGAVREQLEREARDLRAQEFDRLVVAPLVRWIRRALARPHPMPARMPGRSASSRA